MQQQQRQPTHRRKPGTWIILLDILITIIKTKIHFLSCHAIFMYNFYTLIHSFSFLFSFFVSFSRALLFLFAYYQIV